MSNLIIAAVISIVALFTVGLLLRLLIWIIKNSRSLLYTKANVMTPGELRFYKTLIWLVRDKYYLFPQVRLANVVKIPEYNFLWKKFLPLGGKCVDFVMCDKQTGETILVIELDDKSHLLEKRKKRDKFVNKVLEIADVHILHINYQSHYENADLINLINQNLPDDQRL